MTENMTQDANGTQGTFKKSDYRRAYWARFWKAIADLFADLKAQAVSEAEFIEARRLLMADAEQAFADLSRIADEARQHWGEAGVIADNAWVRHAELDRFFREGIPVEIDGVTRTVTEQDVTEAEIESTRAAEAASKLGKRAFTAVGDAAVAREHLKVARAKFDNAVADFRKSEEKAA